MAVQTTSPAVQIARAHAQAWSNHDLDTPRAGLADDVKVSVTTTAPIMPPVNTVGIEAYMVGLESFSKAIIPGTLQELAAIGDDRNALLLVTAEADFGFGKTALPQARLYLLDDHDRIAHEQVLFFAGS
jgi:hypothetical protein